MGFNNCLVSDNFSNHHILELYCYKRGNICLVTDNCWKHHMPDLCCYASIMPAMRGSTCLVTDNCLKHHMPKLCYYAWIMLLWDRKHQFGYRQLLAASHAKIMLQWGRTRRITHQHMSADFCPWCQSTDPCTVQEPQEDHGQTGRPSTGTVAANRGRICTFLWIWLNSMRACFHLY